MRGHDRKIKSQGRTDRTLGRADVGRPYVFRERESKHLWMRVIAVGMRGGVVFLLAPAAAQWARGREAVAAVLITSLGYFGLDTLTLLAADGGIISEIRAILSVDGSAPGTSPMVIRDLVEAQALVAGERLISIEDVRSVRICGSHREESWGIACT